MVEYGFLFNDISTWLAYGGLLLFIICFLYGYVVGEEGGVEPVNFSNKVKSLPIDEQDMYAIATGDEEYLAAHCTFDTKEELRREKEELQRMRNRVARMKLKKQMDQLQQPSQAKPKAKTQVHPLVTDCIDAMVAMGEKKSAARATVNKYFANNPNTNSVEGFISGVFQK